MSMLDDINLKMAGEGAALDRIIQKSIFEIQAYHRPIVNLMTGL